jgi:hypothetical protein
LCPLSVNPFPDVRRTVPEFDAPTFAERQEVHGIAVNEADVRKIDGEGAAFLIDRGTEDGNVVLRNPPADAQHHEIPPSRKSVDSAGHDRLTVRDSKRLSTRKLLKWSWIPVAVIGKPRGFRESRKFNDCREIFRQT